MKEGERRQDKRKAMEGRKEGKGKRGRQEGRNASRKEDTKERKDD